LIPKKRSSIYNKDAVVEVKNDYVVMKELGVKMKDIEL